MIYFSYMTRKKEKRTMNTFQTILLNTLLLIVIYISISKCSTINNNNNNNRKLMFIDEEMTLKSNEINSTKTIASFKCQTDDDCPHNAACQLNEYQCQCRDMFTWNPQLGTCIIKSQMVRHVRSSNFIYPSFDDVIRIPIWIPFGVILFIIMICGVAIYGMTIGKYSRHQLIYYYDEGEYYCLNTRSRSIKQQRTYDTNHNKVNNNLQCKQTDYQSIERSIPSNVPSNEQVLYNYQQLYRSTPTFCP